MYKEENFEKAIENDLIKNEFKILSPQEFTKETGLFEEVVWDFLVKTQSHKIEGIEQRKGTQTKGYILRALYKDIERKGYLKTLREGFQMDMVKFDCLYFKPSSNKNTESLLNYEANEFYVTRQLQYDKKHMNELDVVISINGFVFATMELKNPMTGQTVKNAINQYKKDRNPADKFLSPDYRALVHFAVDTNEVYMATTLAKEKTFFLPFNKGVDEGAGNPNVKEGYKTDYLWNEVLSKDNILELIRKFIFKQGDKMFFPRYHQWDVVKKIVNDTKTYGTGKSYLVQHSAGSGKSNSISWLAHNIAYTHDLDDNPIFDSVLVVTDRRALDGQLRENIRQFERVDGVVAAVDKNSAQLAEALQEGKKIIVTTIQKFEHALEKMESLKGSKFAVIIDEAHSGQTGENKSKMNQALIQNEGLTKMEHIIKAQGNIENISYFAFTATPKPETQQLFGTKNLLTGKSEAYHLYSMKQAIEEGFILDVLQNYTTFKRFYQIREKSNIKHSVVIENKQGRRQINEYIETQELVVQEKAEFMVEHFVENVQSKIKGKAKAMVVTSSIEEAILYYMEFKKLLVGTGIKSIVAFSGEKEVNGEMHTEEKLNGFNDNNTPKEFQKDEYKFLIVADKYQTGFDQPLLHTMYVNKKLKDVNCVQTLSRLNRTHPGKTETFVLDFVNKKEDVAKSFQPFYKENILAEDIDFNDILALKDELHRYFVYTDDDLSEFWELMENPREDDHVRINKITQRVYDNYESLGEEEQKEEFEQELRKYVSGFNYITQILRADEPEYIKVYEFGKKLSAVILANREYDITQIKDSIELSSYKLILEEQSRIQLENQGVEVSKTMMISDKKEEEMLELSELINIINLIDGDDSIMRREGIKIFIENIAEEAANENREMYETNKDNVQLVEENLKGKVEEKVINNIDQHVKISKMMDQSEEMAMKMMEVIMHFTKNKLEEK